MATRALGALAILATLVLGIFCLALASNAQAEQPAAGETIRNQASLEYSHPETGAETLLTNTVTIDVLPVAVIALSDTPDQLQPPGEPVAFPHELSNSGNVASSIELNFDNATGDDIDLQDLYAVIDTNGNGIADAGEPTLVSGAVIELGPGESIAIVVGGTTPANSNQGEVANIRLEAVPNNASAITLNDRVTIDSAANLQLQKTATPDEIVAGESIAYQLIAENRGDSNAIGIAIQVDGQLREQVLIRDEIPAQTSLATLQDGAAEELFHLRGAPEHEYVTVAPADLATVDAVAVAIDSIAPGETLALAFTVTTRLSGQGSVSNVGFVNSAASPDGDASNTTSTVVNPRPAELAFFADGTYQQQSSSMAVGGPLYLQATALSCNFDPEQIESLEISVTAPDTGDTETFIATETGEDTGIFRVGDIPTRDGSANPVVPGNAIVETVDGEEVGAAIQGCTAVSASASARSTAAAGLVVDIVANPDELILGDIATVTTTVTNFVGSDLENLQVAIDLPAGYVLVSGSVQLNGQKLDTATVVNGQLLVPVAALGLAAQAEIEFLLQAGPGAASAELTAAASGNTTAGVTVVSNTATTPLKINRREEAGTIIGKVFVDCDRNLVQGPDEVGIPGVRLLLQDGSWVISDAEGKYSFFGIPARTQVLRIDPATLPAGAEMAVLNSRNAGDPQSRFVDLSRNELHKANFAEKSCTAAVMAEVTARRAAGAVGGQLNAGGELASATAERLLAQPRSQNLRELAARGVDSTVAGSSISRSGEATESMRSPTGTTQQPAKLFDGTEKSRFGFVGLNDGEQLFSTQIALRVQGPVGLQFALAVNDRPVGEDRVSRRAADNSRGISVWEYLGVDLQPGDNRLEVIGRDGFGNVRERQVIQVRAPGQLDRLQLGLPETLPVADGVTTVEIAVTLRDEYDIPVATRTQLTLESTLGTWLHRDLDEHQPGIQILMTEPSMRLRLRPPVEPDTALVRVTSGVMSEAAELRFVAEQRKLLVVGLIEGGAEQGNEPLNDANRFDESNENFSSDFGDGKGQASGRAAIYASGNITEKTHLTLRYDSEHDEDELFRDIDPDRYYPIHGDSGINGFDARSTSEIYARVDRGRDFALYGDYNTRARHLHENDALELGRYQRSVTGGYGHAELGNLRLNGFVARNRSRQVVDELRGLGVSGPYQLSRSPVVRNSEVVEILIRDADQPALILDTRQQRRFEDYVVDEARGEILFRAPVSSITPEGNPVSLRVTYEVNGSGDEYWLRGFNGQYLLGAFTFGGSYAYDENPENPQELASAHAMWRYGSRDADRYFVVELAQSDIAQNQIGRAWRAEWQHAAQTWNFWLRYGQAEEDFDNPSGGLTAGREEVRGRLSWRPLQKTAITADILSTEDLSTGDERQAALLTLGRSFDRGIRGEIGSRYIDDDRNDAELITARAKLSAQLRESLGVFLEGETAVSGGSGDVYAVGGDWQVWQRTRLYARHEFVSSLNGRFSLDENNERNTTLFGVESGYLSNGRLYSEYRMRDSISGRQAEAAIGLRNRWDLSNNWRLNGGIERISDVGGNLSGTAGRDSLSISAAIEYLGAANWKFNNRLEYRDSEQGDSWLHSLGYGHKLGRDWSLLARTLVSWDRRDAGDDLRRSRLQLGLAWRDTEDDVWNALARYEFREDVNGTTNRRHILASNLNWQPDNSWIVSGYYGVRFVELDNGSVDFSAGLHLLRSRVTWDISERWDAGLQAALSTDKSADTVHWGLGPQLGYLLMTNLWISAGYNVFGLTADDLDDDGELRHGPFIRFRWKFDEHTLGLGD